MRFLMIFGIVLLLGLVGIVVTHEHGGSTSSSAGVGSASSSAPIATLSHGEEVDVAAHVPADGLVIVEFTADW